MNTKERDEVFADLLALGIHPVSAGELLGMSTDGGTGLAQRIGIKRAPAESLLPMLPRALRARVTAIRNDNESEKHQLAKKQELARQEVIRKYKMGKPV